MKKNLLLALLIGMVSISCVACGNANAGGEDKDRSTRSERESKDRDNEEDKIKDKDKDKDRKKDKDKDKDKENNEENIDIEYDEDESVFDLDEDTTVAFGEAAYIEGIEFINADDSSKEFCISNVYVSDYVNMDISFNKDDVTGALVDNEVEYYGDGIAIVTYTFEIDDTEDLIKLVVDTGSDNVKVEAVGKVDASVKNYTGTYLYGQYDVSNEANEEANEEAYTDIELVEMARDHYKKNNDFDPPVVAVDSVDGDIVTIHLYEDLEDHVSTCDWYYIDRNTGKGTNMLGDKIDLTK